MMKLLCLLSAFGTLSVSALEFSIPNPRLSTGKKIPAGASRLPVKWKLAAGDQANCIKWVGKNKHGEELSHIAISKGVTLTTQFNVSELTEKEARVKGDWMGVLSVDHLGTLGKGSGRCELSLNDAATGKKVASITAKASHEVKAESPTTFRVWKEFTKREMAELSGKKLELRLVVKGSTPVVVSGVSFSRLHNAPTRKLFSKPNGNRGPDLLGVGSLGFDAIAEHGQKILVVIKVRKNSPADKAGLKDGDKIIGIAAKPLPANNLNPGWDWFYNSHESTIGRAVSASWSAKPPQGRGVVSLELLRAGRPTSIRCRLSQSMDFQNFLASKNKDVMYQQMNDYLVKNQQKNGSWRGPIRTTFATLALLATQDSAHAPSIKRGVDWMLNKYPEPEKFGSLGYWFASYAGILYAEYYLATGDTRVLPRMVAILRWMRSGAYTSKWGMLCLGHGANDLPYEQKALVSPAAHALVFDSLAEKCGIESGLWDALLPYMEYSWSDPAEGGHGAMGYNPSYKDKGEFWSRSGLFAMGAYLRDERQDMGGAMIDFMRGHYPWIRNSHAYGEPGGAIGLLALNLCRPEYYKEVMNEYGWWFSLAWEPKFGLRFTMPHMGAPYMGTEDLVNSAYALVLAAPKKTLFITGGGKRNWLDVSKLKTPLSPVIIRRDKQGKVALECRLPGPKICYTTDGTEPSKNSSIYQAAIDFPAGGTFKARAFGRGIKLGKTATATFGPAKAGWKVLAASGHKDPAEAARRAGYAIDHSPSHSWLTDVGEGAGGYPHYIVVDLGGEMNLKAVKLTFKHDKGAARKCTVKGAQTLKELPTQLGEAAWTGYQADRQVNLSKPFKIRYLRLEFSQPFEEKSLSLALREIDVE